MPDNDPEDPDVEELAKDAARRNPDETTRREALELDLAARDRSAEGEVVGDEMD
jgi:hypothetical protein